MGISETGGTLSCIGNHDGPKIGIFFLDDNIEHMAFSVTGRWGESGKTVLRVSEMEDR